MAEVEDATALLLMALRDLHDGKNAMAGRLPTVRGHAQDGQFVSIIAEDERRSAGQREALASIARSLGEAPGGPPNIWLRAILDDADNDASTVAPGVLLDIALVGALRKAKQSERVSYETAIGLADALGLADAAGSLRTIRDEEAATDDALATTLGRLCDSLPSG
jgi:ferritin-like metal-binding protein YciE